jgi:hypothetical protein
MSILITAFSLLASTAFKYALSAALAQGKKSEFIISQLKKLGLDPEHPGPDFSTVYAHALVVYRVDGGRDEFLELLRDDDVTASLRKNMESLSEAGFENDVLTLIERLAAGDAVKAAEFDVKLEAKRFWSIFKAQVQCSRPPSQVEDHALLKTTVRNTDNILLRMDSRPLNEETIQDLVAASLMGCWMDEDEGDRIVAEELSGKPYSEWINSIRLASLGSSIPVSIKEKRWTIERSDEVLQILMRRLFDADLERFQSCAKAVLDEKNPKFELPPSDRIFADFREKKLSFSNHLRKGMAETAAILGSNPKLFSSCSIHKAEGTAYRIVSDLLSSADGLLWASLNDLLPTLAEASPDAFLKSVRNTLEKNPSPFSDVYAQEGGGIFGSNYMTGLLWGLERLAWNPDYMAQVVILLGDLAAIDPGGNWANRPINSIKDILLPWKPHTLANAEKRRVAMQALLKEQPNIGWSLVLRFLPNSHEWTHGTVRPIWRNRLPEGFEQLVTRQDYSTEVSWIMDVALTEAACDNNKLLQLIEKFPQLWEPQRERLLNLLTSDQITGLTDQERLPLWEALQSLHRKHIRFSDADWAMSASWIEKLLPVIQALTPKSPSLIHRYLFTENEFDLYNPGLDWDDARKVFVEEKQKAILDVYTEGGIAALLTFSEGVQSPFRAGESFGTVGDLECDHDLLPIRDEYAHPNHLELVRGFVWGRFHKLGWQWVDEIRVNDWSPTQVAKFFAFLPFTSECWERIGRFSEDATNHYWETVRPNPYNEKDNLTYAISKFIERSRINEAIYCVSNILLFKKPLPIELSYDILSAILKSEENQRLVADWRTVILIIKNLQDNTETPLADLEKIEWAYLELLEGFGTETFPKTLEAKLASDADYYCKIIRSVYRSKNEPVEEVVLDKQQEQMANQSSKLLWGWRTPPGFTKEGGIDGAKLKEWVDEVKRQLEDSGHWEHGAYWIGHALFYAPKGDAILEIIKEVADVLNQRGYDKMREGFRINYFNSHSSFSGNISVVERQHADKHRGKAELFETAGYIQLADTFRDLARGYEAMAEQDKVRNRLED